MDHWFPSIPPNQLSFLMLPWLQTARTIDDMLRDRLAWYSDCKSSHTKQEMNDVAHDALLPFLIQDEERLHNSPIPELIWFMFMYIYHEEVEGAKATILRDEKAVFLDFDIDSIPGISQSLLKLGLHPAQSMAAH